MRRRNFFKILFGSLAAPVVGRQVVVEYAMNTSIPASELETLDVTRIDVFDRAEYPWREVSGGFRYDPMLRKIYEDGKNG